MLAITNLPGYPPFTPMLAVAFVLGLVAVALGLRRREPRAWTLLLWWGGMCIPALLAADANPHFVRLFGALPAALLLAAWPLAWLGNWSWRRSRGLGLVVALLLTLWVGGEGARTARAYFITWAKETDLYAEFMGDMWNLGEQVEAAPDAIGIVPLTSSFFPAFRVHTLDYAFRDAALLQMQVDEENVEQWLGEHLGDVGELQVMVPLWHEGMQVGADPKRILPFYLEREGVLKEQKAFRGFDLLTFSLGTEPQFQSAGHRVSLNRSFASELTLVEAPWGVGYPNPTCNGDTAAAGTPVWAILTWRLEQPRSDLKVTLDLVDGAGHRLDASEVILQNASGLPVSEWETGGIGRSYHLVTIPDTQPPGPVTIESRAYDAQTLVPLQPEAGTPRGGVVLANLSTTPALEAPVREAFSPALPMHAELVPGIILLGLDAPPEEVAPGQTIVLRLLWEIDAPFADDQVFIISLGNTGAQSTVHLSSGWPVGQRLHTYADLQLPPDAPSGDFPLTLIPPTEASPLALGQMTVAGRPRRFKPPSFTHPLGVIFGDTVSLLGMDVPAGLRIDPGQTLTLALVWQVRRTPDEELIRFVHFVGENGQPLAQEDVPPLWGSLSCKVLATGRDSRGGSPPGAPSRSPCRELLFGGWMVRTI